jgi:diguanylate cyclase (GGDEF)-like protein/PAS domain S-box-containing protein
MNHGIGQSQTREEEDQLRAVFDSVGDGIFVCDAETGTLTEVNATGCAMFGRSRDELIGCSLETLSPPLSSVVQRDLTAMLREAQTRGPQVFEWLCSGKDGNLFWSEISLRCALLGGRLAGLAIVRDITHRKTKEDEVVQQAHFDALTGLPNRRNFEIRLKQEIARAARYGGPLSVAMGDIDHFKAVNDRFGHHAGDVVLKSVADLMRKSVRQADFIARWGGEEFIILLPETSVDIAEVLLNRLRTSIGNEVIAAIGRAVTLSFGVTAVTRSEVKPDTPDELVNRVDRALYRSKQSGRNKVTKI